MTISFEGMLRTAEARAKVRKAAAEGLGQAAEYVLGESNTRVPIEEGGLEDSGTTSLDEAKLKAAISYNKPYAARQHEELTWHHPKRGEAKYLENAFNEAISETGEIIAGRIKKAIG